MVLFSQVSVQIAISALVEYMRLISSAFEKGLVCSDMVESQNDEEKLGMPQRQHCHETLSDARLS